MQKDTRRKASGLFADSKVAQRKAFRGIDHFESSRWIRVSKGRFLVSCFGVVLRLYVLSEVPLR